MKIAFNDSLLSRPDFGTNPLLANLTQSLFLKMKIRGEGGCSPYILDFQTIGGDQFGK